MNPSFDAFLRSWPNDPWLAAALIVSAAIYFRGWSSLRRHDVVRWHGGKLAAFWGGLATIFIALASPLESFADLLLMVHMLQHMLLLMLAAPLLWLADPLLPMLRGFPKPLRRGWVVPILRSPLLRDCLQLLTRPVVAWLLFALVVWGWHTPRGYELALADPVWHVVEHISFLVAALLFWYPVVLPYPSRPRWSRWIVLPYLVLADVQNTVLAAWLTFSSKLLYPHYDQVPRIAGWSALEDQHVAGVIMWVPGSLAFLLPVFVIGISMLFGRPDRRVVEQKTRRSQIGTLAVLPVLNAASPCKRGGAKLAPSGGEWNLLDVPALGRFLRWPRSRTMLQAGMLLLALVVILDGFLGPRLGPANLAGVAPWIHWRGLVMLGMLVGGNFFCMACPFTMPRKLASRWLPRGRSWPRMLRSKWLAVALVAIFLWSYEAFSLWNSPWLTAWIAVGYFAGAFVIDGLFRGAAFCKYVCPIGQFNFVQSLVSPLEIRVQEPAICATCRTKECIRGSEISPGCEMHLFQPRKQGNLDCTFCLDCMHACPHANVGILASGGIGGLSRLDNFRSGIGRLAMRSDIAALVLLLAFGAFANAGGMIAPVVAWQDHVRAWLGEPPLILVITGYYLLTILFIPLLVVVAAGEVSRRLGDASGSLGESITRFAFSLVPLGFAMWLAHHGFHFFTSYATILPVSQRVGQDLGFASLGDPQWQHACCVGVADWIVKFELLSLDFGLLASLLVAYRLADRGSKGNGTQSGRTAFLPMMPWALIILGLFATGVWIVLEPMQMRGTLPGGG